MSQQPENYVRTEIVYKKKVVKKNEDGYVIRAKFEFFEHTEGNKFDLYISIFPRKEYSLLNLQRNQMQTIISLITRGNEVEIESFIGKLELENQC